MEEGFYYIPITTFFQFMSWLHLMLTLFFGCVSSVGVALSRGHGKYFFRGNVSVEAGMSLQTSAFTLYSETHVTLTCLFRRPYWLGLPRLALLKRYWLVFFRAPWSGTARCRPSRWMVTPGLWKWAFMRYVGYPSVFIRDVEACDVTVLALFWTTGLTATQRSSTSTVTWPRFKPSSSSWRAADHTSNVRHLRQTDYREIVIKQMDVLGHKGPYLLNWSEMLRRWQRADPGGVIWCSGHSSTGGLLDWTGPQQVRVRTFLPLKPRLKLQSIYYNPFIKYAFIENSSHILLRNTKTISLTNEWYNIH